MLKTRKILNNNALLAVNTNTLEEVIYIGNGVGFGQKVNMEFVPRETDAVYVHEPKVDISMQVEKNDPVYLEIASEILQEAKRVFENIDSHILLPLSDHIAFAIERINNKLVINNPFAHDIALLFDKEHAIAVKARVIIHEKTGVLIPDDEVGYITLHIHSARSDDNVSEGMLFAVIINEAIKEIEETLNIKINVKSLAYSRLLTHMKYMIARAKIKEKLNVDMDDYTRTQFPLAYEMSKDIVRRVERAINQPVDKIEIGYLALHIQRICTI